MMAIGDAGERYPQKFRIVCSAGEPLNPEAIRWFREQYGLTVLDYYGLTESYPLCANYPFMEVREGSMGKPVPGLGRPDPRRGRAPGRPGRARRDLPAREVEPALPARLLEQPGGLRGDLRRGVVPHQGRGQAGRGRLLLVRGASRRRDHLRRLPDRAVRGRVGVHRAPRGARGRRRRLTRPQARPRRQGVRGPGRGPARPPTSSRARSRPSSADTSPPTPTRARSSSSTTCRRRSPARSGGSSCGRRSSRAAASRPRSRRTSTRIRSDPSDRTRAARRRPQASRRGPRDRADRGPGSGR